MTQPADNPEARAIRPGRRSAVTDAKFNPNSLIGSWLHIIEAGKIVADGLVVGEPGQGVYLVETTIDGQRFQQLYSIRTMIEDTDGPLEWRFYDSDSEMREAYAAWLVREER